MIDMRTLWNGIYENLHGFDDVELEQIKQAVFYEVGKYDFQPKPEHTELVVYDDDKKGYTMFFVAKIVEGLAEKSLKYYKEIIDKFFEMIPKPLNILTSDDIRFYLARRQIERKCAPATMDNERRILNTFFRWLSDEGYIEKNICSSIKKVRTPKRKKKAFSETDCAKIRDACFVLDGVCLEEKRKRAIALVEFLLSTGCRVGEIAGLKREDIDLEQRTAIVFGKGSKERTVFLTPTAKMRLLEYWEIAGDKTYAFEALKDGDSTFDRSGIEYAVREIGKTAGVKNCHPHRFRRTAATFAIRKGMSLLDVQRMLGHQSMDTTKIYLDLDDSDLKYQHDKFF